MTRPFLLANVNRATLLDFAEPAPTARGMDQRPRTSAAWGWASWADLFNLLIALPTLAVKSGDAIDAAFVIRAGCFWTEEPRAMGVAGAPRAGGDG